MKNEAIVNGATITREQATKALEEMNGPEPEPVKSGDRIQYATHQYMVVAQTNIEQIVAFVKNKPHSVLLVDLNTGIVTWDIIEHARANRIAESK